MNLNLVMDEVAQALKTLTGLNVFPYPKSSVTPPAGLVSYPEKIEYDQTYRRGKDRIRALPVWLVVGKVDDLSSRDKVAGWCAGSGPQSVKATLEAVRYSSCDVLVVTSCDFDTVTIADIDYLAAMFELDISGRGA